MAWPFYAILHLYSGNAAACVNGKHAAFTVFSLGLNLDWKCGILRVHLCFGGREIVLVRQG